MLDTLITSKTRIKLLLKFFLNSKTESYLRNLESEFGESSNAIRVELNRFEEAGLLNSSSSGNKKIFKANTNHPLFNDIHNILLKFVGLDQVIDQVTSQIGDLHSAFITGQFATGIDSQVIELLLIGDNIDRSYVAKLVDRAESMISRKISFSIFSSAESSKYLNNAPHLLIWKRDEQ